MCRITRRWDTLQTRSAYCCSGGNIQNLKPVIAGICHIKQVSARIGANRAAESRLFLRNCRERLAQIPLVQATGEDLPSQLAGMQGQEEVAVFRAVRRVDLHLSKAHTQQKSLETGWVAMAVEGGEARFLFSFPVEKTQEDLRQPIR